MITNIKLTLIFDLPERARISRGDREGHWMCRFAYRST
jgi:hypothetical protein